MDTVTVIIPVWNRENTIVSAVRSALDQTWPVMEVLVCDDGSIDNTKKLAASINDTRVKVIEGQHSGRPAVPRNRGIHLSKGEWIAFLDSDDAWLPQKIEKQFKILKQISCQASSTNAFRVLPKMGRSTPYLNKQQEIISFDHLIKVNGVICSSVLVHRSVLEKTGGFPEEEHLKAVEDYALWLRISTLTNFAYLEECLVDYCDDPAGSIRAGVKEREQRENVIRNFWEWTSEGSTLNDQQRKSLMKQMKTAMKNNGRSFWERRKIK
ncbi:MAG: glycosyltransferase family 2 protein [Crocinitomicaceae bacterium]|nr:glycosyltransferase family 2 protein [Crocinitomicaceae bacterium]